MVPSVCNKSARIVGMLFRAKTTNFVSWSKPNKVLFWGNDLEFILMVKNTFQRYITCLCMKSFAKKSHFSRQFVKLKVKLCLILCASPTGTRNQDLRLLTDSFWHHESNGGLRFGKWASVENYIFRGKPYYLNLHEISITWYPELCFGNWAYP